jgi:hypothetical protein
VCEYWYSHHPFIFLTNKYGRIILKDLWKYEKKKSPQKKINDAYFF